MGKSKGGGHGKVVYVQPAANKVPYHEWSGKMAAYLLVKNRGQRSVMGGNLDLFRGPLRMVEGGTDTQLAELVAYGARFEAEFTTSVQASQALAEFEAAEPEFVEKVKRAIEFGTTGK